MALTLTNITLTNPADKSEIQENFTDIQNKFSGNIVNADISSSAAIAVSKLAATYQTMIVTLQARTIAGPVLPTVARSGAENSPASLSASTTNHMMDMVPLPGISGDGSWTVSDASFYCSNSGTASGSFKVEYGYLAAGVFTEDGSDIIADTTITSDGASIAVGAACTINSSTLAFSANSPHYLVLAVGGTLGTAVMGTVGSMLTVSLTLTRQIQAGT